MRWQTPRVSRQFRVRCVVALQNVGAGSGKGNHAGVLPSCGSPSMDRLHQEIHLHGEEIRIQDARIEQLEAYRRPQVQLFGDDRTVNRDESWVLDRDSR